MNNFYPRNIEKIYIFVILVVCTYCSTNLLVGNGEPKIDGMYNISNPNHIISLKHLITQLKNKIE